MVVWRRYDNRQRDYRWIAETPAGEIAGWEEILARQSHDGWELVAACTDSYQENNTSMDATGYRLFFKRPA